MIARIFGKRWVSLPLVCMVGFVCGVVWFKERAWPYYQLEALYVTAKFSLTGGTVQSEVVTPSSDLKNAANQINKLKFEPVNKSLEDLLAIRRELQARGFSRKAELVAVEELEQSGSSPGYELNNYQFDASKVVRYQFDLGLTCEAITWLIVPEQPNPQQKLLIVHQGHRTTLTFGSLHPNDDVAPVIDKALASGLYVSVMMMPMFNTENLCEMEYWDPKIGPVRLTRHTDLSVAYKFEETLGYDPLSIFLAPIKAFVDQIEGEFPEMRYYMTGLSGGGWTTTVYSALDERIDHAFPVAGNVPFQFATRMIQDVGDYEQTVLAEITDYSHLYVLAALKDRKVARSHTAIYNVFDPCCFASKYFDAASLQTGVNEMISFTGLNNDLQGFRVQEINGLHHSILPDAAEFIVSTVLAD